MSKVLFIGDIVGKPGRKILKEVLPQWQEKYQPDVTIVNVENLAHGKGVTLSTLAEIDGLDIDCLTGGNHIFNKDSGPCFEKYNKLIRPANFEGNFPGHGYYRFSKKVAQTPGLPPSDEQATGLHYKTSAPSNQQFLIINLNAQVFMDKQFEGPIGNPFLALDQLLTEQSQKGDIIIVDFHSEATSEKISFGYYCDGRVTGIFGTHTHVPTADARVLPGGAAYISDVGMTGPRDGVLGVKYQNALKKFLDPNQKFKNEVEEQGMLQINGVLIEVTSDKLKVKSIEKLYQEIN